MIIEGLHHLKESISLDLLSRTHLQLVKAISPYLSGFSEVSPILSQSQKGAKSLNSKLYGQRKQLSSKDYYRGSLSLTLLPKGRLQHPKFDWFRLLAEKLWNFDRFLSKCWSDQKWHFARCCPFPYSNIDNQEGTKLFCFRFSQLLN